MKRLILVLALAVFTIVPAAAQRGHDGMKILDEATLAAAKQLATNLLSWARADVLPEVQTWKNRLDASMSPADLAKLNELRRQATALKARHAALALEVKGSWRSEDYDALKKSRSGMKALKEERKAIMEQLKPIAIANKATLQEIGELARPKIKEWTEQARSIGEQWYESNKGTISPMAAMAIGRFMQRKHDLAAFVDAKVRTKAAAAHFMLWNGDDVTRELERMIDGGGVESLQELNLE